MPEARETKSLAVLIDADNTSAKHAQPIFDEIVKLGEANVRRIYGDFSGTRLSGWDKAIQSLAILQHQQRSNSKGKNASDIALVIDAMDLMYKRTLDGVLLVSSDSDFTRLAQRLREEGLDVYGFGERKAVEAFRNACNRFIYVENLTEPDAEKGGGEAAAGKKAEAPSNAVKIIATAIEGSDDDGWANLSDVGKRLLAAAPDFDPRTYGCRNLSTLVEKSGGFEIGKGSSGGMRIRRKVTKRKAPGKAGTRASGMRPKALAEAQEAFRCRETARYQRMAAIVTRLSEALARNGRFAVADRVQDVAMALERMYVPDENNIGRKLRNRTARFLGTDAASEQRIKDDVRELYDVRSDIVHNRLHKLTPERVQSAFVQGFDLARQSLFKLLREGPPEDWAAARGNRSQRIAANREIAERPGGNPGT